MKPVTAATLLTFLAILVLALPGRAALTWCKSDPVVSLNGTLVDITVGIPLEYEPLVTGPVRIEVQTPESVERELVLSGPGFNGYGEEVRFSDNTGKVREKQFPATIKVRVPIDKPRLDPGESVPVEVTVLADNAPVPVIVEGTSDMTALDITITGR